MEIVRELVRIEQISKIEPIEGADRVELATVKGWKVVVLKEQFTVGSLCVYCEVDTVLPETDWFEFLRKSCWSNSNNGFRIKTARRIGVISEGICFPLSILDNYNYPNGSIKAGVNLTELFNAKVYTVPETKSAQEDTKCSFPSFIPKTDLERIQNNIEWLKLYADDTFYITIKMDGSSCTVFHRNGYNGLCSRTLERKYDENGGKFSKVVTKYDIFNKLSKLGKNIAIQGEMVGRGIQANRQQLDVDIDYFVYSVFDIDNRVYYPIHQVVELCKELGLKIVPIETYSIKLDGMTVDDLINMSNMQYCFNGKDNVPIEGLVFTCNNSYPKFDYGKLSFKVISPEYKLKYNL